VHVSARRGRPHHPCCIADCPAPPVAENFVPCAACLLSTPGAHFSCLSSQSKMSERKAVIKNADMSVSLDSRRMTPFWVRLKRAVSANPRKSSHNPGSTRIAPQRLPNPVDTLLTHICTTRCVACSRLAHLAGGDAARRCRLCDARIRQIQH